MRMLFFGAGPLGSLYAHLLHQNGEDVTVLDRGERYHWIKENGLVLVNEMTGEKNSSPVNVVNELRSEDKYDLVIVLVRRNKLPPIFEILESTPGIENILFMGNNALGFDEYLSHLPTEKLLFGFPGAGGGIREQVVHYADREKPGSKRRAVTIGEIDGRTRERTLAIKSLFESAGIPVDLTSDIDGWLKYHVALVSPLVGALYKHDCDCNQAANNRETCRALVRAAKEGGDVLSALGYTKRQPFQYNLFYWLPEFMNVMAVKGLLNSKFAEIAFAMHARAARDEFQDLAGEFEQLAARTALDTPNIDNLKNYIFNPGQS
jgi:2-dehydropantoate 2-reductase